MAEEIFISYSRKDIAFAHLLVEALKTQEMVPWIDWESIPPSADWLAEIYRAIEGALSSNLSQLTCRRVNSQ